MNFKKQHIVLLLLAALVLGGAGAYIGVTLAQSDDGTKQKDIIVEGTGDEKETELPENMSKVVQAYGLIQKNSLKDVNEKDLIEGAIDRKSTRLNSSHVAISYAVFCLKKKK